MRTIMNEKRASRLFWAVKALLAGILLYVAVAVIVTPLYLGRALKPLPVSGDERRAEPTTPEPRSRPPADLSTIVENSLFAGGGAPAAQVDAVTPGAPDTKSTEEELGLKFIGAIAGDPNTSRAVIQNVTTGAALPYKIGDMVGAATVESIESDRVVLRHVGKRKVLPLQSGAVTPAKGRPSEDKPLNTQNTTNAGKRVSVDPQTPGNRPSMSYVEDVFHKAKIEPYVQNGRTEGLKITGLESTPLSGLFGLKNGDVVQTVNGQSLTSKQKAFQVLQKAKKQSTLQIQLLRDGKAKELSFDLQ
jgi:general secretion pathway protein C